MQHLMVIYSVYLYAYTYYVVVQIAIHTCTSYDQM